VPGADADDRNGLLDRARQGGDDLEQGEGADLDELGEGESALLDERSSPPRQRRTKAEPRQVRKAADAKRAEAAGDKTGEPRHCDRNSGRPESKPTAKRERPARIEAAHRDYNSRRAEKEAPAHPDPRRFEPPLVGPGDEQAEKAPARPVHKAEGGTRATPSTEEVIRQLEQVVDRHRREALADQDKAAQAQVTKRPGPEEDLTVGSLPANSLAAGMRDARAGVLAHRLLGEGRLSRKQLVSLVKGQANLEQVRAVAAGCLEAEALAKSNTKPAVGTGLDAILSAAPVAVDASQSRAYTNCTVLGEHDASRLARQGNEGGTLSGSVPGYTRSKK
jgi:hypothetical protein